MVVHRCLFLVENDNLKAYFYNKGEKKFEIIKKQGEEVISIDDNVWEWWKEEASFNSEKDIVDFCIICDKDYDFLKNINFKNADKSIWKKDILERFFKEYIEYSNVCIINGEHLCKFSKGNAMFADNSIKRFYTNIDLSSKSYRISLQEKKYNDKTSVLAQFFMNKLKNEKNR